jgi:hypothetical protein
VPTRTNFVFDNGDADFIATINHIYALVSAIEALMPPPKAAEKCPECNRSTGPGPTRQFVDFVEASIPGSGISKNDRRRFYQIRSALTHGGKLLAVDHHSWGFDLPLPISSS